MEIQWPSGHECKWACTSEADLSTICAFSWAHADDTVSGTSCDQRFKGATAKTCCQCLQSTHNSSALDSGSGPPCNIPRGSSSVFLIVYKSGSFLGFSGYHTDLAWCQHSDLTVAPHRLGHDKRTNKAVSDFLQKYNCREVIWDGRNMNRMYSNEPGKLGKWPPDRKFPGRAHGKEAGLFYMGQTMLSPEEWEAASEQCHGPIALQEWRDFNPRTFHQLHHNSNHWTYQALRFLNLPDGSSAQSREEILAPVMPENKQLNPWKASFVHWTFSKSPSILFGTHPRQYVPWISKGCRLSAEQLGIKVHKGYQEL